LAAAVCRSPLRAPIRPARCSRSSHRVPSMNARRRLLCASPGRHCSLQERPDDAARELLGSGEGRFMCIRSSLARHDSAHSAISGANFAATDVFERSARSRPRSCQPISRRRPAQRGGSVFSSDLAPSRRRRRVGRPACYGKALTDLENSERAVRTGRVGVPALRAVIRGLQSSSTRASPSSAASSYAEFARRAGH